MFRVTLEQNDTAKRLNLTGIYNLDITPDGVTLIASTTETVIAKWKFKNIKGYSKSGNQFSLDIGKTSQTGEGKLVFNSNATRELFGIFHRNIKKLKLEKEMKTESLMKEQMVQLRKKKDSSEEARQLRKLLVRSVSQDLQSKPRPRVSSSSVPGASSERRTSCPDLDNALEHSNIFSLEGLFEEDEEEDEVSAMLHNLDPFQDLSGTHEKSVVGFESSFTSSPLGNPFADDSDPFKNVTDPFSSSAAVKGTFYNSDEDILGSFDDIHPPTNMSTPIRQLPSSDQHQHVKGHSLTNDNNQSSNPFAMESFVSTSAPLGSSVVCNPLALTTSNGETFSPASSISSGSTNPEFLQVRDKIMKQHSDSIPMKLDPIAETALPTHKATTAAVTSTHTKRGKKQQTLPEDLTETLDDLDQLWKDLDASLKTKLL